MPPTPKPSSIAAVQREVNALKRARGTFDKKQIAVIDERLVPAVALAWARERSRSSELKSEDLLALVDSIGRALVDLTLLVEIDRTVFGTAADAFGPLAASYIAERSTVDPLVQAGQALVDAILRA